MYEFIDLQIPYLPAGLTSNIFNLVSGLMEINHVIDPIFIIIRMEDK